MTDQQTGTPRAEHPAARGSALPIPYGTYVLAPSTLGKVIRARPGPQSIPGYDVEFLERSRGDAALNWVADYCVRPALVGVNVCAKPRFTCSCGLKHVPNPHRLPTKGPVTT